MVAVRSALTPPIFTATSSPHPGPGAPAAAGGPPIPGIAMSGTSLSRTTGSIAFIAGRRESGLWRPCMIDYVELHARSAFSFLEGSSTPEDLAGTAAELGLP